MPTEHAQAVLHIVNGSAIFWDLSHVPEDWGGRGDENFLFQSPRQVDWKWEWIPVKIGYPPTPPTLTKVNESLKRSST
ncbi:unnamed protein product [Staurois parvus]|uniref:Uncharacterized protein n=1 Tax=Staurois parvus TaxID=386267 RepID=A0ABN9F8H9_9NEOB|nr:unnamed protein product [Staurois parvus]